VQGEGHVHGRFAPSRHLCMHLAQSMAVESKAFTPEFSLCLPRKSLYIYAEVEGMGTRADTRREAGPRTAGADGHS
jgi:hypothetical protein